MSPISAPRCLGSAAMVLSVSHYLEQHRIDQWFVVVSDRGYWLRHCEHDMEVLDRQ
jgi:hypothetical protein